MCKIGADTIPEKQTDYYFFSRKDKKYPTGNRANRATTAGFWKATGRDKAIYVAKDVQQLIGMRKTLVFYEGRAPHGNKTDWIMHEFRLDDGPAMPAHVWILHIYHPPSVANSSQARASVVLVAAHFFLVSSYSRTLSSSCMNR